MEQLKVLLVDDEENMLMGMERVISRFSMNINEIDDDISFDTKPASTGEQALELVETYKPDIMVLDYKLPGINGIEVLEEISSNEDKPLIIMITAYASLETAVSAIKAGAFEFLSKPFTPKELKGKISKAAQSIILSRQIKKLSEEKKKVRFQFISVLGHELKAPLNAIAGYLDIIKERELGDELKSYDEAVSRSSSRIDDMYKLIADLLEMTKIESGEREREISDVNLRQAAEESMETFLPVAKKRNIELQLFADENTIFNCDRQEIDIIFNNLISNAIKYNSDNGKVTITLLNKENYIEIIVKDTGIGISEEEQEKLFKEFSRIKNKKTRRIPGSGLGLSTVKKISEFYEGSTSVSSTPGKGSEFRVELKKTEY